MIINTNKRQGKVNLEDYLSAPLEERYKVVGIIIKNKRNELNITIEQLAKMLNLKQYYIEMIEKGDFINADMKIYYYGYVTKIANILKLETYQINFFVDYFQISNTNKTNNKNNENNLSNETTEGNDDNYVMTFNNIRKTKNNQIVIKIIIIMLICYIAIKHIAIEINGNERNNNYNNILNKNEIEK